MINLDRLVATRKGGTYFFEPTTTSLRQCLQTIRLRRSLFLDIIEDTRSEIKTTLSV